MYLTLSLISLSRHRSLEDLSVTELSLGGVRKLIGGDPGLVPILAPVTSPVPLPDQVGQLGTLYPCRLLSHNTYTHFRVELCSVHCAPHIAHATASSLHPITGVELSGCVFSLTEWVT